jgi:hypothetical protein
MTTSKNDKSLRERALLLGDMVSLLLQREALEERRYNASQPRAPAGQPNGEQWVGEGGGEGDGNSDLRLAGGFADEDMSKTVQQFMSEKCKAGIRGRMPGEFLDNNLTIGDIMALKRSGNSAAITCIKLLREDRFRK